MDEHSEAVSRPGRIVLLSSVFLVAASGLVYQLVAGAVASYLMGDAVTQFSLVIGVFLSAMGLGSYLAQFVTKNLFRTFVLLEVWIGLIGGCSSPGMFAVSALAPPLFPPFFYTLCATLGILIGVEIPLLVRILKETGSVSRALSHVLALDYVGALAGALLFPLVVLPLVGLSRASGIFGLMNLAVAYAGYVMVRPPKRGLWLGLVVSCVVLVAVFAWSAKLVGFFEDLLYQDAVIYADSTRYQRVVLTRWRGDVRLYLNGHIQFSSVDEARYHEPLVIPAMEAHPRPRTVLVLGGGDGMAAREVLKYDTVEHVVLVDLDPVITEMATERPEMVELNRGSLRSPRVEVVNTDAMRYLESSRDFFDVILADLPDPSGPALAKLYSTSFYALVEKRLSHRGVFATHATSPFYAPRAYWCVVKTVAAAIRPEIPGLVPLPYHVNVPSFGEWGFLLAARHEIDPMSLEPRVSTRFLNTGTLQSLFVFPEDMQPPEDIKVNRLEDPVLPQYYRQGWNRFNQ
ncbi:MAG: polyamine aminopropyltransferase [Desulfatibacillaceae bacterium]